MLMRYSMFSNCLRALASASANSLGSSTTAINSIASLAATSAIAASYKSSRIISFCRLLIGEHAVAVSPMPVVKVKDATIFQVYPNLRHLKSIRSNFVHQINPNDLRRSVVGQYLSPHSILPTLCV